MALIEPGKKAPAFTLKDQHGKTHRLADYAGRPLVLYFYPKDDTPGCTKEAIGFSESYPEFQKLGVEVIGVSKDSVQSHEKFRQKYGLCFPLASDASGMIEAFGSWVEKSMYGKSYMGVDRSTFLIDADGRLVRIWRSVKVPGHVDEVLKAVKLLKKAA